MALKKIKYLRRNIINFIRISYFKLTGKKIIVINEASGLGDYIWARHNFRLLKESDKFKDYKIILLGTSRWRDFAKKLDSKYIDMFVFFCDPFHALPCELDVFRFFTFDIFINRYKEAGQKVISESIKSKEFYEYSKLKDGVFYDGLNKNLISQLLDFPEGFKYVLDYRNLKPKTKIEEPYAILVLSGYTVGKMTKIQITEAISSLPFDNILILGVKEERPFFEEIANSQNSQYKKNLINGCGVYEESELPYIVDNCEYIITPNTGIYHMALQLNKKGICLARNCDIANHPTVRTNDENMQCVLVNSSNIADISSEIIGNVIRNNLSSI